MGEAGRRVVTFVHVSNPEHLPIATLEGMGEPGWSKVDGLRYVDNSNPRQQTTAPTAGPTNGPTKAPTPFTVPTQNYCGLSLEQIRGSCYMAGAVTCNEG